MKPDRIVYQSLTEEAKLLILSIQESSMFSPKERRSIERLAIEQAKLEAEIAKAELEPLMPTLATWPFPLSDDDRAFLRVNKISAA